MLENLLKTASLWSHPCLGNLNETRNASSSGFFLKILNSIFQSIDMSVDHKLLLQLFLIGLWLFCKKNWKKISCLVLYLHGWNKIENYSMKMHLCERFKIDVLGTSQEHYSMDVFSGCFEDVHRTFLQNCMNMQQLIFQYFIWWNKIEKYTTVMYLVIYFQIGVLGTSL